jgi:hypothetical protein
MTKQLVIAIYNTLYCTKGERYYISKRFYLGSFSIYDLDDKLLNIVSNDVDVKQGKLPSAFILLSDYREQLLTEIIEEND